MDFRYLHTPLTCIVSGQSAAYALKWCALYAVVFVTKIFHVLSWDYIISVAFCDIDGWWCQAADASCWPRTWSSIAREKLRRQLSHLWWRQARRSISQFLGTDAYYSRSFYRLFPELLYAWILLKTVMRTVVKVVLVIEWIEKTSVSIAKSFRFIWNFSAWTVLFWDITHSGVPVISLETVCWIKLYSKESDVMFSVSNNTDVCACTISVRFKLCVSFNCSDDIYVYVYLF